MPVEYQIIVNDDFKLKIWLANVNLAIGSLVWVEDPEVVWTDGEFVGVNDEEIEINCTSGKTVFEHSTTLVSELEWGS